MIKIKVDENKMKEIEQKHWEWFEKYQRSKLCEIIKNKKITMHKEEQIIDDDIIDFLIDLNNNFVLEKIVIGKLYNNTINFKKIDCIDKRKLKTYVNEKINLDELIFIIIKRHFRIFKHLLFREVNCYLNNIKKEKIEKIRDDENLLIKDKNQKYDFIKKELKEQLETYIFQYLNEEHINNIKEKIDNIKIKNNILGFVELLNEFKYDKKKNELLKKVIFEIFNYNNFINLINSEINWGAYELLEKLNITTCPYCNRQYVHTYISESGKTRADIDHFYPKSKYPFLAVSLYNFIPSCHTCNSSFKGSIDFYKNKAVYPYEEEFGEAAKFETKFYTNEDVKEDDKIYDIRYLLGNSDNFKIEIKPKNYGSDIGKKIQNSIDTFHLENLYNFHKDYIRELIKKAIIYNESRIDELYTQYPELFSSREEVVQMVVSNYICDKDLSKRPLSKLTKDICEELGLRE